MRETLKAFYYHNSNLLVLKNARDTRTGGTIINSATGTAQVLDRAMLPVTNGGPVALAYIAASQGQYECTFSSLIDIPIGQFVNIEVLMDGGTGLKYRGVIQAKVVA